ncbi:MAG: endonuclease III domain-containing protein [Dehalococcoidia bacterium]|nr:endonuclease III domain-containing protein [Dehalococcoidia bacterium]
MLLNIYERLFALYGPQHWWPGDSPFEVMVGAILTQSAAWQNVEKAIRNLKTAGTLSPQALSQLPVEEIARLIYPSGYYNAKARKLKALVEWLGEACGDDIGKLSGIETDELRRQLLAVHGVGPETADSILLYALGKPVFVIDAYTRRIMFRLGLVGEKTSYEKLQKLFMDNLQPDVQSFNEYHALLVRLGKTVCRKQPLCRECPLFDICPSNEAR